MPRFHRRGQRVFAVTVCSLLAAMALSGAAIQDNADDLDRARALAKDQHWAEAREAFDRIRDAQTDWHAPRAREAVENGVACSMRLQLWDDALSRARQYVDKVTGSLEEAVGRRMLAGLYLNVPHQGTKRGSTYLRGQWTQGVYVSSWKKDRRAAIEEYEKARTLLSRIARDAAAGAGNAADDRRRQIEAERIGIDFDLVSAIASVEQYYGYRSCGEWWWGWQADDEEDSDAVDEADYEEPRRGWWGRQQQSVPMGVPVAPDGAPRFITAPRAYDASLGDGQKVRFLLQEIQELDSTDAKDRAAQALLRWAMIARSLYGPEVVENWRGAQQGYDRFGRPLPKTGDDSGISRKVWELADDETITVVGGKLRLVTLTPAESPLAILRQLERQYPASKSVPDARYTRGLYYQTRQQFPQAIREYDALINAYPRDDRARQARERKEVILRQDAALSATGVYLPDAPPKITFTYRNTDKIEFTATSVDLYKYVRDGMEDAKRSWWEYRNLQWSFFNDTHARWKNYLGRQVAAWHETVPRLADHRAAQGHSVAPLNKPGAYVIEARPAGTDDVSRALVLITDIAIVQKNLRGRGLIYVCDARTGRPLPGTAVRIYEQWTEYKNNQSRMHWIDSVETANADGAIEYHQKHANNGSSVDAIAAGGDGRIAISFFQQWSEQTWDPVAQEGQRVYVITDRPVYRPGEQVRFRAWIRNRTNSGYDAPQPAGGFSIEIYDPKGTCAQTMRLEADKHGGIHGKFALGEEPPLGLYGIRVSGRMSDGISAAGGTFRVEEYKKPEFEVTVKPATRQARLGEKVQATINARYYFGAPVAAGAATYKVFRETYHHVYWGAAEYDWLYGPGYGYCWYPYPWFGWWGLWGRCCPSYWPYWGGWNGDDFGGRSWREAYTSGTRKALREVVAQGNVTLGADGTYSIEFDTAKAKAEFPNDDHRYTIEVDVRDISRRTISGSGSVFVTRQAFYAYVETQRGFYDNGNNVVASVRTITPDNTPVSAQGQVVVSRIEYGGAGNLDVHETTVKQWSDHTDADGRLELSFATDGPGQYRITFKTRDAWEHEVQGNALVWVTGPKFDGRVYRFNELEIVTDKRAYKPGEAAHLLLNSAQSNARVIFSDDVVNGLLRNYRFIDLPNRTTVIDVPVTEGREPNFFVEATLVREGRVFTEQREVFVPPAEKLLSVAITTDKPTYQPGEKGHVRVTVKNADGTPATGQATLTAFDEAVTYIQDEMAPSPKAFFHGQRRRSHMATDFSSSQEFQTVGSLTYPEQLQYLQDAPPGWNGSWDVRLYGLHMKDEKESAALGGAGGRGRMFNQREVLDSAQTADRDDEGRAGAPAARPASESVAKKTPTSRSESKLAMGDDATRPPGEMAAAELRVNFSDTALWSPVLELDENGTAQTDITFPQSLTTWRIRGYAISPSTQVGDGRSAATTSKNVLVRLQSPRFFVERDEVVLSAVAHNYLKQSKEACAELLIPADLLEPLDGPSAQGAGSEGPDKDGYRRLIARATIAANGEYRFDWPVKVRKAGLARITTRVLTDAESDAMQMAFPVLVHGTNKTVAASGSYRVGDEGAREIKIDLPADIDAEQTKLEIVIAPTLAGVMLDALPYLAGYPYGCTEQTMSRFYPAVLVRHTLRQSGVELKTIAQRRKQMFEADVKNRFARWTDSPVFDDAELDRMIRAGLDRLYAMQASDGGWGWWREDASSPFQTAYVVQGLRAARDAGVKVNEGVYSRAVQYLLGYIDSELFKKENDRRLGDVTTQAYLAYIVAREKKLTEDNHKKWITLLFDQREKLSHYGRALLALALHANSDERAATVLRNLLQFVERDDSNETAWLRTPQQGWWFWWNNDIETNAWALKALAVMEPRSDVSPRIVKWLLNNRRNGHYWRSTRDTAQVIAAMSEFMRASGESSPEYDVTIELDDRALRELHVTPRELFTLDNRIALHGLHVKPGPHTVTIRKRGQGALYYSTYLSYFTKEEDVRGAGNEIFVTREYYRLTPRTESVRLPDGAIAAVLPAGQSDSPLQTGHAEDRAVFSRTSLKTGDQVTSGDMIEVVLKITSKNDYDFLAFEDFKPAGCEPVEVRSGGRWAGGLCANVELRDEKVVFFIALLAQGTHELRYKMRAETPGAFHALPTNGFAMYAPEVKAISDEMRLGVRD